MIIVFSYNRLEMLKQVVKELAGENFVVLDDGSSFDLDPLDCSFVQFEHMGKAGFWRSWNYALELCKESDDDFFLFLQDDLTNIELKRIKKLHDKFKGSPYVYSLINDGRENCFIINETIQIDSETINVGFVDCIFFCNRSALEALNFELYSIPLYRFRTPGISSGVGQQLTKRFDALRIPMYKPIKSLAFHGDHDSVMHKEERIKNPLISK